MTKTKEEKMTDEQMKKALENPFDARAMEESVSGFIDAITKPPKKEDIVKVKKTAMTIGISLGAGLLIGYLIGKKR